MFVSIIECWIMGCYTGMIGFVAAFCPWTEMYISYLYLHIFIYLFIFIDILHNFPLKRWISLNHSVQIQCIPVRVTVKHNNIVHSQWGSLLNFPVFVEQGNAKAHCKFNTCSLHVTMWPKHRNLMDTVEMRLGIIFDLWDMENGRCDLICKGVFNFWWPSQPLRCNFLELVL